MSIRLEPSAVDGGVPDILPLLRRLHHICGGDSAVALLSDRSVTPSIIGVTSAHFDTEAMGHLVREVATKCISTDRSGSDFLVARYDFSATPGGALAIWVKLDSRTDITVVMLSAVAAKFAQNGERALRRVADWIADHLKLWWQLRCTQRRDTGINAALDITGEAVFILDREARLLRANSTARQMLDAGDGLRVAGETLTTTNLNDSVRLHAAISQVALLGPATGLQQAPVLSVRRSDRRPVSVAVLRSTITVSSDEPVTVVLLAVDPEVNLDAMLVPVCRLYGLSNTEVRLTLLLVGGASLREAALAMRIQEPTARAYLKQVFAKSGVNRQASLIHLMLTGRVRTGPDVVQMPLN